jgi:S-adenosylmethionine-dependent methyltransferase
VARQVAAHMPDRPPRRVLGIGCGQGTQALALARRGHLVVGLDNSARLLSDFRAAPAAEPPAVGNRVRLVQGAGQEVDGLFGPAALTWCCAMAC